MSQLAQKKPARFVYTVSGFILAGFGFVGLAIPGWPTTIFMILALWCFRRGSEKFEALLLNNRIFGQVLRDWDETRSMTLRAKIVSISTIWLMILISIMVTHKPTVKLVLLVVAVALTVFLVRVKTKVEKPA